MKNGMKRYSCIRRITDTTRYFSWYKGVVDDCINGLADTKNVGTKVSEIAAVHRDEFGEKFLDDWLTKYFIRKKLEGQYIVATIFTQRKKLVVKHEGKTIKTFPFPIKGHIIDPLLKDKKKRQIL